MPKDFIVKDSGERMEFASGMVRDTQNGKVLWHLVASGPMLMRYAVHLTMGAVKYGQDNWLKATGEAEYLRFKTSAFRHFMQWYYGEIDEDHASAVIFNINGAEMVKDKMDAAATTETATTEAETVERSIQIAETPENRKRRLWEREGRPSQEECFGLTSSHRGWHCELPSGHTGKHSAPGYCEDW